MSESLSSEVVSIMLACTGVTAWPVSVRARVFGSLQGFKVFRSLSIISFFVFIFLHKPQGIATHEIERWKATEMAGPGYFLGRETFFYIFPGRGYFAWRAREREMLERETEREGARVGENPPAARAWIPPSCCMGRINNEIWTAYSWKRFVCFFSELERVHAGVPAAVSSGMVHI